MAEGLTHHLKSDLITPYSAGIETHGLNPYAVEVMGEIDIDISGHRSKLLDDLDGESFDYVITVCGHAHETCPWFPGDAKVVHHGFDDPPKLAAGLSDRQQILDCYRTVRDDIRAYIDTLPQAAITA